MYFKFTKNMGSKGELKNLISLSINWLLCGRKIHYHIEIDFAYRTILVPNKFWIDQKQGFQEIVNLWNSKEITL